MLDVWIHYKLIRVRRFWMTVKQVEHIFIFSIAMFESNVLINSMFRVASSFCKWRRFNNLRRKMTLRHSIFDRNVVVLIDFKVASLQDQSAIWELQVTDGTFWCSVLVFFFRSIVRDVRRKSSSRRARWFQLCASFALISQKRVIIFWNYVEIVVLHTNISL